MKQAAQRLMWAAFVFLMLLILYAVFVNKQLLCSAGLEKVFSVTLSCVPEAEPKKHEFLQIAPERLPEGRTQQSKLDQKSGCTCRPGVPYVSPSAPIAAEANKPVSFYLDSSPLCWGQSVREIQTTVTWPSNQIDSVAEAWGLATATFNAPGAYKVKYQTQARCEDRGARCNDPCFWSGETSISVK